MNPAGRQGLLRVLSLEDSPRDFEIIRELLLDAGYDLHMDRVDTEEDFASSLDGNDYDIILADFKLPGFDAFTALEVHSRMCPHIPLVCVSGSIGEETAIELIRRGAVDYILKDQPERLPVAVKRALDEAHEKEARRRAEESLQKSEEKYRSIFENAVEGMFQTTPEGRYLNVNPALVRMYGYDSPGEMIALITDIERQQYVDPADRVRLREAYEAEGFVEGFEAPVYRKDGSVMWISMSARAVRGRDGAILCYEGTALDITQRKRAEEQLKASLREKEFLLKEIHHRVKNNLQVMSSLLNLQAHHLGDSKARDMLKVSMDRIKSMALIHDKLYRSESLSSIFFPGYIHDLAQGLVAAYTTDRRIGLELDVAPAHFDIDTALPLGLIVNELVSNALKHAFPGRAKGTISIDLRLDAPRATLTVTDDGIGFPEDLDFTDTPSLGMQLVMTLVEQIEGKIELKRGHGTEFRINFEMAQ